MRFKPRDCSPRKVIITVGAVLLTVVILAYLLHAH